ncbi:MAG: cytidylate kinase family protein [Chloroflexi bacterium]|nr:cytidylate kinase family protein [Chloroflexota bacterium]
MSVVAVGGLFASGGRLVGDAVAKRLGADYVDRLILAKAARELGATVQALHNESGH